MDPGLEAFIPLIPRLGLTGPVTRRKNLAERAAATPAPDTSVRHAGYQGEES